MSVNRIVIVTLVVACIAGVSCRKHSPLLGDEAGRRTQAAECQFGKTLKELGSTWFADLGPPFGVMYCIRCECVPYHRKRRVVGKVHCRNIKHECPKPSCDEPVLLPGRCCKVCPGDNDSPDIVEEQPPTAGVEEEKSLKHFAAVLTSKMTPTLEGAPTIAADRTVDYKATGRFTFHKRNLYYSFYTSVRPRGVQFVDMRGNILEEQVLTPHSAYQNDTDKVCGVWRRIPREYRRLVREERLQVTLLWERAELAITGQLYRYRTLATELYSALLEGSSPNAAGTAIVSVSTQAPSIHLTLVFTGVFGADDTANSPVTVRLYTNGGKERVVLEEVVRVEKPSPDINVVEVRSAVSNLDLNQMSRQRLSVTISSRSGESISGVVRTRATCELFHAPLAAPPENEDKSTQTTGMAWMYIDKLGALRYHVRLDGVTQPDVLGLVVDRRLVELEDLTPSFHNGWANGTIDQINTRHLEQLYNGELAINVATTTTRSLARGRLAPRPVADARDAPSPSLLVATDSLPTPSSGLIWAAVDNECNLHYEVVLSGTWSEDRTMGLYLEDIPLVAPGAPVTRRLLEEFAGNTVEGFVLGLTPTELTRLDTGVVHFDIKDLHTTKSLLKAHWRQVSIPPACLPHYSDNNVPPVSNINSDANLPEQTSCFHSDSFHDEGAQWVSRSEPCTMCNCHHGRVKCDPVVCPTLPCTNPTLRNGQCCPTCDNSTFDSSNISQGCYLAGQLHAPGSSWHPYLPPAGFDTCAVCHCNSSSLTVRCMRTVCPPLDCDETVALRRVGCCKTCPTPSPVTVPRDPAYLGDQQSSITRSKADVLAAGGCTYPVGRLFENGEEWHPRVFSHGEVKSVKCRCKDGVVKCERRRHH
ncbi:dorsal-ventral patterning protein Sog-like [Macrosteles quadrilineatus]|uniref:dorsal-ventral patterning protein Sog-like n=1 Tax=Macrosteles quadrilineatus TaxID=74068 RepID=UPI0023E15E96|nr:dorsal-ventral patterning protein Sog-like [Macrosteles quadrilineatus]XP_054288607.1 dorsal-ventral patterning protein Sog-like [Macrosteles quadrilineatus]